MRLIRLRGKLNEIRESVGVDLVIFEAARGGMPGRLGALVVSGEIQGVIKVWCQDNGIEYRGLSPSEIKKHATGKGNASKAAMISAARLKWPNLSDKADDNEVDAKWILDLAGASIKN
jgi:Holliday junction resolvasome RuvABC endonuclease subunit